MKRFLLLLLLPLIGCAKPPATAVPEESVAPVKVASARKETLAATLDILGTAQPLPGKVARVSVPFEGRVESLLRDAKGTALVEGQQIDAGTVIAQLDTRIIAEQKRQAELAVEQGELEVNRLKQLADARPATANIPLVSKIELDKANLALKDAQSRLKGLQEQMKLYTLTAPIAGRLGLVQAVPGQTLAAGAPIAEVVDLGEVDVLCFVPASRARQLALQQHAHLLGAAEDAPAGAVVFIAVQAQADTGTLAVKVRFPNPDLKLRANTIQRVAVEMEEPKERLVIPEGALLEDNDPPSVVVVEDVEEKKNKEGKEEKFGKARRLRAIVGIRDRAKGLIELIRLEDPNKEGKEVAVGSLPFVVEGGTGLHDGDRVKLEDNE